MVVKYFDKNYVEFYFLIRYYGFVLVSMTNIMIIFIKRIG